MAISALVDRTLTAIAPLDDAAMAAARARQDTLTKPLGSLGRLEELSVQLAGIFADRHGSVRLEPESSHLAVKFVKTEPVRVTQSFEFAANEF